MLCLPLGLAMPILWGVAIGSVLTALLLGIAVKLAVESMVQQNFGQIEEQLDQSMMDQMNGLDQNEFDDW